MTTEIIDFKSKVRTTALTEDDHLGILAKIEVVELLKMLLKEAEDGNIQELVIHRGMSDGRVMVDEGGIIVNPFVMAYMISRTASTYSEMYCETLLVAPD